MQKEVTIYDIANELGYSIATVSRALKNDPSVRPDTKKKIQTLAQKRGYQSNYFASSLRKSKTHTIGVIMHELNSHFMVSVLAGIEKVLSTTVYDIIIAHSAESAKKEIANVNNLFHKRVDGILAALSYDTEDLSHFDPYVKKNIPVVFFDRVDEKDNKRINVTIDNFKAGFEATNHLIEQGCKRIAHITGHLTRNVYSQRFEGYKAALKANKIAYKENLLFVNDLQKETCVQVARSIAKMKPMPDGIFITNDISAAIMMQTFKELNIRIPEDIAIVGFNNDIVSTLVEPKLTTINYPGTTMGEIAAKTLLNCLQEKNTRNIKFYISTVITSDLIVRESSVRKKKNKKLTK
jgi:LacI family transcriptional regulator